MYAQTVSVVYSFDAEFPVGTTSLIQAADGNFYGTAVTDLNDNGAGMIFRVTPAGVFTTLYDFGNGGGGAPQSLSQGPDGNFYGVAEGYGSNGAGTFFRITPAGVFTVLYNFDSSIGSGPVAIVLGADGNFYGTTAHGDPQDGTIFKITPAGEPTQLHVFNGTTDGSDPDTVLIQGSDDNFYGATFFGGPNFCDFDGTCGTIFKVSPAGSFTTVLNLSGSEDESLPTANALVEGIDNKMYDTTQYGGANFAGSFFNLSSATDLYDFTTESGIAPGPLFLGSDGNFYGVTSAASNGNYGTFFGISPAGQLTVSSPFAGGISGSNPNGAVVQGSDGNFYGYTSSGGSGCNNQDGCGVIFKVNMELPPPVQLSITSSNPPVDQPLTLNWKVLNAPSLTMQQCYASTPFNSSGAGNWTGLQVGTISSGVYAGSTSITPTAAGVYTYALTCGGTESGSTILRVGNGKAPTTTAMQWSGTGVIGSVVTLTATPSTVQDIGPITGSVAFSYGSYKLGSVSLSNGSASLSVPLHNIATGTYPITATYSGDSNYQTSNGTTNVIVQGYQTSATLSAYPLVVDQGQSATLTTTVNRTSTSGTPTGTVTFYAGSQAVGSASLVGGVALLKVATNGSLTPSTYSVSARYSGDSSDQPSYSNSVDVTLISATTTTLTVSPNPVPNHEATTLTATVKQTYGNKFPTGKVTFMAGTYLIGSVNLDGNGQAILNASDAGINPGTYLVTASYSGDSVNGPSSNSVNVVVQ
jgi:uncharacterized repeat protein (TIGR03803 family)